MGDPIEMQQHIATQSAELEDEIWKDVKARVNHILDLKEFDLGEASTFRNEREVLQKGEWLRHMGSDATIAYSRRWSRSGDILSTVRERILTAREDKALVGEVDDRWNQPATLYLTIGLNSISAAIQGWDQTGLNAANLVLPEVLHFPGMDEVARTCCGISECNWILGLVNGAPYLTIAFFSGWLAHPLNNWFGRRTTIFIGAIFGLLAPLGAAYCATWPELLVCRILLGVGMGLKEVTVPIFSAESAPERIRGGLVMSWQTWTAFGIFVGCSANLAVSSAGEHLAWRLQVGAACIPAITLLLGIWLCPESPRWLMKKKRYPAAFDALTRLRNTPLQAARDFWEIHDNLVATYGEDFDNSAKAYHSASKARQQVVELFTKPRNINALVAACVIMLAQQLCGINVLAFYSSTIFRRDTCPVEGKGAHRFDTSTGPLWYTWGFGLTNFLFAWPAVFAIDTFGRRVLPLFSTAMMCWTLLVAGLNVEHRPIFVLFSTMFTISYSLGMGPIPFAYSAEVFQLSHRELGMSAAVATNNFWAAVLSLTTPLIIKDLTPRLAFVIFSCLNVLSFVLIFFFVPETKQYLLERLDDVFCKSVRAHPLYQVKMAWWGIQKTLGLTPESVRPFVSHDKAPLDDHLYARFLLHKWRLWLTGRPSKEKYSSWKNTHRD